jgi:voltage-gated potassium channel
MRGWRLAVQGGLILLILANVLAVVLETVEPLAQAHADFFEWFEIVSVAIFAVEYAARLYAATENPRDRFRHPLWGRLRFALTPLAIVDLLAILPIFLLLLFGADVSSLRILRILRIFKLMHYSPAMAMLGRVLWNERKALGGALAIFVVVLLLSGAAAYFVERDAQPKTFGSIPDAMWWAMAALTTVGYGDVTPATPLGRIIGSMVALFGIAVIALPVGIIASAFVEEHKRRDFTVTWSLLAEVPFFKSLMAPRIADLVRVLRPRFAQPGDIILRKGDEGDSMFIIASGEVEVEFGGARDPVLLGPGQFFGELALIERTTRTATVRADDECKLLELNGKDFHELARHHPELKDAIHRIAAERKAVNTGTAASPAPA